MIFTEWLTEELQKRNWTPARLARESGITKGAVSHVLTQTRNPGPVMCVAISKALQIPVEEVFRVAGLFDGVPESDSIPTLAEWVKLYRHADQDTRVVMLETARKMLQDPD